MVMLLEMIDGQLLFLRVTSLTPYLLLGKSDVLGFHTAVLEGFIVNLEAVSVLEVEVPIATQSTCMCASHDRFQTKREGVKFDKHL